MADRDKEIRKFQRAARQRMEAASLLKEHGYNLEAVYLGGYAVECEFKALILRRTPANRFESVLKLLTKAGAKGHDFQYLLRILTKKPISCSIPRDVAKAVRGVDVLVHQPSIRSRSDRGRVCRTVHGKLQSHRTVDRKELRMSKRRTKETQLVEQVLKEHFPNYPPEYPPAAYSHGSLIYVRVVDKDFSKVPWYKRLDLFNPTLDALPDKTQGRILFVALVTPDELEDSPLNYKFEHPTPLPRFPPDWRNGQNTSKKTTQRRDKREARS